MWITNRAILKKMRKKGRGDERNAEKRDRMKKGKRKWQSKVVC